jgi:hypothetical protein
MSIYHSKMKIAIIGSRRRTDKNSVIKLVNSLPSDACVISGGCRGVDSWAVQRAKERGLKTIVFRPNLTNLTDEWEVIRRFYARNKRIAEEADVIYAFVAPDRRGGTENTIKWAKQLNKKVILRN